MADRVPVIGSGRIRNNSMKLRIFWDMQPCSLGGVGRRFRVGYRMVAVCTSETSVYSNETTRRLSASYSTPREPEISHNNSILLQHVWV
jgi:hypothetical protein